MPDGGRYDEGFVPTSHRGLTYPFGKRVPGPGEIVAVARGIGWARIPMPGSLGHINVWALDDGASLAIVDTGLGLPVAQDAWEALFAGPLIGRRIDRVVVTHMHPDHVGMAGWLCDRDGAPLSMTRGEWLTARMLRADSQPVVPAEAYRWWRLAGYDEAQVAHAAAQGWGRFAAATMPIPGAYHRLRDGAALRLGGGDWRVVTGNGHSPEHACLLNDAAGVLIAGDQVLPRITSNVSLGMSEPEADPLGDWLASIDKLLGLPAGLLVLPAHGEPFTGLHARLAALRDGHLERLAVLAAALDRPKTALEVVGTLFGRAIGDDQRGLAAGEALAHLRRLELDGRATRLTEDGVARFVAT